MTPQTCRKPIAFSKDWSRKAPSIHDSVAPEVVKTVWSQVVLGAATKAPVHGELTSLERFSIGSIWCPSQ